jgi:RNA polymerase sigma factor (sigma-70 family)
MKPTSREGKERRLANRSLSGCLPRHVPLSPAQQQTLFRRLRQHGTSARERDLLRSRLVSGTLQIVLHCLRRVGERTLLAEMVQEGVLALARAVDLFVKHERTDFSRFAAARVSRWLRRFKRKWLHDRLLLVDQSVDALADNQTDDPFLAASQIEREERLEAMIEKLPHAQQRVLRLRFGIGTREAQSRDAISRELRMERQRVKYLEECALLTLRRNVVRQRPRKWRLNDRGESERTGHPDAE